MRKTRCLLVLVTCPSVAIGRRLGAHVVNQRLAACVNLLRGVDSTFWWQGKTDRAREVLLLIKTTSQRFPALKRAILAAHPYEVPEILALPISAGHAPYLAWVTASLRR